MKVVFSNRAFISLLVETKEKITTETGGVFLGFYRDGVWYVVESIDPGPNSIFKPAYFEYDTPYINHLINKVSRIYNTQLELIGLWHRHPGSLDSFSSTDDGTNTEYAKIMGIGAISALVNIDPEFRLTVYHVSLPLKYQRIEYEVGDEKIPFGIMEYHNCNKFIQTINIQNKKSKSKIGFSDLIKNKKREKISCEFGDAIHVYLKKRTMSDVKALDPYNYSNELPIEKILCSLEKDLDYLNAMSVSYNMSINARLLELYGQDASRKKHWKLCFGVDNDNVVFKYNELVFKYHESLLKEMICEYLEGTR